MKRDKIDLKSEREREREVFLGVKMPTPCDDDI
jgi:hypothetical protein